MKILTQGAIAAGLLALTACGTNTPAENAAENIEAAADNQADYIDDLADNTTDPVLEESLENQADAIREAGENQAEAVEAGEIPPPPADTNGM